MAQFKFGSRRINKQAQLDDFSLTLLTVIIIALVAIVLITAIYGVIFTLSNPDVDFPEINIGEESADYPFRQEIDLPLPEYSEKPEATIPADAIASEYAALYNVTDGEILASRKSTSLMYPASMTKIMTLIVVYENLPSEDSLDEVLEIKIPRGEHSGYGFEVGEKLTVEDLIYAAILQSDGVACITLAEYVAGSEANFVKMMNEKVKELGLLEGDPETNPSTNFTNCTGLHEQYHYTTAYDMSVITAYAMRNAYCAKVLTCMSYKPSSNFRPGEGCTFWNALLHNRLNDGAIQPSNATIKGGKTGWTGKDSGYCIATFARGKDGKDYVIVTAKADGWSAAVDDTIKICNDYIK